MEFGRILETRETLIPPAKWRKDHVDVYPSPAKKRCPSNTLC